MRTTGRAWRRADWWVPTVRMVTVSNGDPSPAARPAGRTVTLVPKGVCMRSQHATIALAAAVITAFVAACSGSPAPQHTSTPPPSTSSVSPTPTPSSSAVSSSVVSSSTTTSSSPTTKPAPKPAPTDPLTGLKLSKNPVVAVKIDNTSAGFPQFGITAADIIYTEQVEGGLTRLIAIFHSTLPKEVGAVRSIRSTDIELLPSYGKPIVVASGGAPRWVRALRSSVLVGVLNDSGQPGFWRSSFGNGTHNLHANLQTVVKAHRGKGAAQFMGFRFSAKDSRLAGARKVSLIDVTMLAGRYEFTYADGRYLAHHSNSPYVDQSGKKVYVQNVLLQRVQDKPDGQLDPIGNPSYVSTTVGSGKFTLYRNGRAISGTWTRKTTSSPTTYVDSHGKPVTFDPGKTWVLLAPQTSTVNKG